MKFLHGSPWLDRPDDLQAPLQSDERADVVIVGGGFTGLSTALSLRAEGADVVVLEQDFAGSGASGRNAGHLTPTIGKDLPTLLMLYGRKRSSALVRFADAAVEYTESQIEKHRIDCDYHRAGNVMAAVNPAQARRLRRSVEVGKQLGAHVRFLPEGEMRERGLPAAFVAGVLEERGGVLDPGRLALGLRRAALQAGVRLYESTTVGEIVDGAPVQVLTGEGSVCAPKAVLATNAYTPLLGQSAGRSWRRRALIPLRVTLFETAPLGEAQSEALGWRGGEGIYTAHESLENYRRTARGTLVGGSKGPRYAYGSQLARGDHARSFARNEGCFRTRFPDLRELEIAHFWGGWIGYPLDLLPSLGATGRHRNVYYGLGYAGHGVAQAMLMGPMLTDLMQGRDNSWSPALQRWAVPWVPEPLRWLAWNGAYAALRAVDAWTDRGVRRGADARG